VWEVVVRDGVTILMSYDTTIWHWGMEFVDIEARDWHGIMAGHGAGYGMGTNRSWNDGYLKRSWSIVFTLVLQRKALQLLYNRVYLKYN
jgi:hypothetical protein